MPDPREEVIRRLRLALKDAKRELLIPAAELVPAIPAVWEIIDEALAEAQGWES